MSIFKPTQVTVLLLILTSCIESGTDESEIFQVRPIEQDRDQEVDFQRLRQEILAPKCLRCHAWADDEPQVLSRVVSGRPEQSRLFQEVESGSMPLGGPALSLEELDIVRRYIMEL